jgi:hypothetical protein
VLPGTSPLKQRIAAAFKARPIERPVFGYA